MQTLLLFTFSDIKTILVPESLFGIMTPVTGPILTTGKVPPLRNVVLSTPFVVLWVWINLLLLNVNNQRQLASVAEDRLNKPWRPLPSGRLTTIHANRLFLALIGVTMALSSAMGGLKQTMILTIGSLSYDKLGGSDINCAWRNLQNAGAYVVFAAGAATVACETSSGGSVTLNAQAFEWLGIISSVVLTSIHTQDMEDQAGDLVRMRKTVPLVIGDGRARLLIAGPVLFWSLLCPVYWSLRVHGFLPSFLLGLIISIRTLCFRTVKADMLTWRLWNTWIAFLYMLPLFKRFST